jgi:hypothetical protein
LENLRHVFRRLRRNGMAGELFGVICSFVALVKPQQ